MDVFFTLQGIDFVWHRTKSARHLRDRGFSFELACEVFFDPFVLFLGSEIIDEEERDTVIGMTTTWMLLVVTYTMRGDTIRIISAHEATRTERTRYENR